MFRKHILEKNKPKAEHTKAVASRPKKSTDCHGECSVCYEITDLKKLLTDTTNKGITAICPHSFCNDCIEKIIVNHETEICRCPLCRKPFTHYGCDDVKAVDDYEPDYSKARVLYPPGSLMRSMKGGKTGKRGQRKNKKNKTRRQHKK